MSWGYLGIVLGVAVMVLVLFASIEIMIWRPRTSKTGEETNEAHADSDKTKHAA